MTTKMNKVDIRKGYSRFAFWVIEVEVKEAAERPGNDQVDADQGAASQSKDADQTDHDHDDISYIMMIYLLSWWYIL